MAAGYKHTTVRKYLGDDANSWAVFDKNRPDSPVVCGLSKRECKYHRDKIEERIKVFQVLDEVDKYSMAPHEEGPIRLIDHFNFSQDEAERWYARWEQSKR